ncbi:hypothetical protein FB451DRAFT_11264 [Mycena latifolia]|nr:hypothetical protein FB451DRAFT_11264 [Mycena latifolia]
MNFFISIAVASLVPGIYALTVNTPTSSSVVVCEPIALSWSDGTAPYYLSIIPGGDTSSAALKSFDSTSDTSLTWTVDIAAGTSISLALKDSTGTVAYSDAVTIQTGSDTSCVSTSTAASTEDSTAASTGDNAAATTATTSAVSGSSGTISAVTSAAATTTKATTGTSKTTSATASTVSASSSNGASPAKAFNYGLAGFLGLFGIVLL